MEVIGSGAVTETISNQTSHAKTEAEVAESLGNTLLHEWAHESLAALGSSTLVVSELHRGVAQVGHATESTTHKKHASGVVDLWWLDRVTELSEWVEEHATCGGDLGGDLGRTSHHHLLESLH